MYGIFTYIWVIFIHFGGKCRSLGCSFACLKMVPHFLGCIWRWGIAAAGGWGSLPLAAAGKLPALRERGPGPRAEISAGFDVERWG